MKETDLVKLTVRVPKPVFDRLTALSAKSYGSLNATIVNVLEQATRTDTVFSRALDSIKGKFNGLK